MFVALDQPAGSSQLLLPLSTSFLTLHQLKLLPQCKAWSQCSLLQEFPSSEKAHSYYRLFTVAMHELVLPLQGTVSISEEQRIHGHQPGHTEGTGQKRDGVCVPKGCYLRQHGLFNA